jgi:hypothetical protein
MDASRFDMLARAVDTRSRRRVLGSVSGVALGAVASVSTLPQAEAKKRRKKGKNKKPDGNRDTACPTCETCPEPSAALLCAQACGASCGLCLQRDEGSPVCSQDSGDVVKGCNDPASPSCSSDNDCIGTGRPYCVTQIDSFFGGTFVSGQPICGTPRAVCTGIHRRCSV